MNRKYLLRSSINTSKITRLIAKLIDLFIVLILSVIFYPFGFLLAMTYLAFCDSLHDGQSVGKKFMGFSVVSLEDGKTCTPKQSFIRNLPFLIPAFFAIIPLWGWIISSLLSLPIAALEIYLLFRLDSGHRLGDVMADTTVVPLNPDSVILNRKKTEWFDSDKNMSPCNRSSL